jgi:hypothetical protein
MTPEQPPLQNAAPATDLNSPAIGLIVAGALGALVTLAGIGANLMTLVTGHSAGSEFLNDPNLPPALKPLLQAGASGAMGLFFNLVQAAANGFIIYAGLQMREAKQYGVCVAGAGLACVPLCFSSCCCLITLPLGIWALVVLLGEKGKARFQGA